MFQGFMPSCYDPTYCETDPPVPFYDNTNYVIPPTGTFKYNDGQVVTYKCQNPSKNFNIIVLPPFAITCINMAIYNLVRMVKIVKTKLKS